MSIRGAATLRRLLSLLGMVAALQMEILSNQRKEKYAIASSMVDKKMWIQYLGSIKRLYRDFFGYGLALRVLRHTICAQQTSRRDAPCRVKRLTDATMKAVKKLKVESYKQAKADMAMDRQITRTTLLLSWMRDSSIYDREVAGQLSVADRTWEME